MKISLVVAADLKNGIGRNNQLMWKLPADMDWFKEQTIGHHVLMGKNTYLSIPPKFRPLPDRVNMVVSRSMLPEEGVYIFDSISTAVSFANTNEEDKLCVIGGAMVYRESLDLADEIILTRVQHTFEEADVFFPEFRDKGWQRIFHKTRLKDERNAYSMEFEIWQKDTQN